MRRRDFITLLGGAAVAWPLAARAQQGNRVRFIGALMLGPENDPFSRENVGVFEQSLAKLGWIVGRNLAIDYHWGVNDPDSAAAAALQVLRLSPDAIFANGSPALTAAQRATRTVPIVFNGVSEPVERGYVASLARPGGNATGFTNLEATVGGKFIELLNEIAPRVSRVTAMFSPTSTFAERFFQSAEAAGQKLRVEVVAAHVDDFTEIDAAITTLAREPGAGLIFPPDGFTSAYRRQIVELTTRYWLPAIDRNKPFAAQGGLASYGPDPLDAFRGAGTYLDRILRGEKPADLPVQSPTKFELVVNLRTAKALGLTVPQTLLVAADEVIE
jgi:putative ABC transport system substrate-binding protein